MAPLDIHILQWHARQSMLLYTYSLHQPNWNTYCPMNPPELSCAMPFQLSSWSAEMQLCPRRPSSQSFQYFPKQYNFNLLRPRLQLSMHLYFGLCHNWSYLFPYSALPDSLTPWEQNLFFFVFNLLLHLLA